jgi:hypothetical protein
VIFGFIHGSSPGFGFFGLGSFCTTSVFRLVQDDAGLRQVIVGHRELLKLAAEGLVQQRFFQFVEVLEVLLSVRFGGGDGVNRLVEDADDPLLFGEGRDRDGESAKLGRVEATLRAASGTLSQSTRSSWMSVMRRNRGPTGSLEARSV